MTSTLALGAHDKATATAMLTTARLALDAAILNVAAGEWLDAEADLDVIGRYLAPVRVYVGSDRGLDAVALVCHTTEAGE